LDDLQIALKPALGAAFSDSSKISCQEWQQFHDKVTNPDKPEPKRFFQHKGSKEQGNKEQKQTTTKL
jgi:hypothetical protein